MTTKFDIEKFDGRNDFNLWQVKMKALFEQQGLSMALNEAQIASLTEEEKKEQKVPKILKKAHSAIQLCLSNEVLHKVVKEDAALKLWSKLESL